MDNETEQTAKRYKQIYNMKTKQIEEVEDLEYGSWGKFSVVGCFKFLGYCVVALFKTIFRIKG